MNIEWVNGRMRCLSPLEFLRQLRPAAKLKQDLGMPAVKPHNSLTYISDSSLDLEQAERYLLVTSRLGLCVLDTAEQGEIVLNNAASGHLNCAKWLPMDAGVIITGDSLAIRVISIQIWDANEGKVAGDFCLPAVKRLVAYQASVAAANAEKIAVIDVRQWREIATLRTSAQDLVWNPRKEHYLASVGEDRNVYEWDLRKSRGPVRTFMHRKADVQVPYTDICRKRQKTAQLPDIFLQEMAKAAASLKPVAGYHGALPTCASAPIKLAYSSTAHRLFVRTFRGIMSISTIDGIEEPIVWPAIKESVNFTSSAQLLVSEDEELVYSSSESTVLLYGSNGKLLHTADSLFGEVVGLAYSPSYESVYVGEAEGFISRWELRL